MNRLESLSIGRMDSVISSAQRLRFCFTALTLAVVGSSPAFSQSAPDEIFASGGTALSFGNTGVTGWQDISNVDINPALLGQERVYTFSGTLIAPISGQKFYDIGVVDSITSPLAVGIYGRRFVEEDSENKPDELYSPATNRYGLGLAKSFGKVSIGTSAQYAKGQIFENGENLEVQLTTFGVGISGGQDSNFRWGMSWQNLFNEGYHQLSPYTVRGGIGYFPSRSFAVMLDYKSVANTDYFVKEDDQDAQTQTLNLGLQVELYSNLYLHSSFGATFSGKKGSIAGGLAYRGKKWTFAYQVARPDTQSDKLQIGGNVAYTAKSF